MRKWNTAGYYEGHQHARNIMGFFKVVKFMFTMKAGESLTLKVWNNESKVR